MPIELVEALFEHIENSKDISINDKVMLMLTCKLFAQLLGPRVSGSKRLGLTRSAIPAALNDVRNGGQPTEAQKRGRLNFMMRLAPYFEDLAVRRDPKLRSMPLENAPGIPADDRLFHIKKGWSFCTACVKYRPSEIFVVQVANKNFPHTVRWVRCVPQKIANRPDGSKAVMKMNDEVKDILYDIAYQGWTYFEGDRTKFPLYKKPPKIAKTAQNTGGKAANSNATASGSSGSAAGSKRRKITAPELVDNATIGYPVKRKKTDAPMDEEHAERVEAAEKKRVKEAEIAREAALKAKMVDGNGTGDCYYMPMDGSGELALAMIWICDEHTIDPVKLVGL
jgi:hypothetical protein